MIFLYIFLCVVALFPLVGLLYRRSEYQNIMKNGVKTFGQVTNIKTNVRKRGVGANYDSVGYAYLPEFSNKYYYGEIVSKIDKYKIGDQIELYYLPAKPQQKATQAAKYSIGGLVFVLLFFLGTVFICYKLYQTF